MSAEKAKVSTSAAMVEIGFVCGGAGRVSRAALGNRAWCVVCMVCDLWCAAARVARGRRFTGRHRDRSEHGPACAQGPAPPSRDGCGSLYVHLRHTVALAAVIYLARSSRFLIRVARGESGRAKRRAESSGCGRSAAGLVTLVVA